MSSKLKRILTNPFGTAFMFLASKNVFNWMSDEKYIKLVYLARMKKRLNLDNPKTFNEKLNWLKIYDRNPNHTIMVDKYEVKKYVADKIGAQYVIPTLGVWDNFDDIDFDSLPDQFVLKCTHDSGGVVICKDKSALDIEATRKIINKSLKTNYYWRGREWPYKNVRPRILAEKFISLSDPTCAEYKMFFNNGKLKYTMVCTGEAHVIGKRTNDLFDADFNHIPVKTENLNAKVTAVKPEAYDELVRLGKLLSEGHILLRVDFYLLGKIIYFGELTFFHDSGYTPLTPPEWDEKLGQNIDINLEN